MHIPNILLSHQMQHCNACQCFGVKHFRDAMADDWMSDKDNFDREYWHNETLTQLENYESEYQKLKEMTSLSELG